MAKRTKEVEDQVEEQIVKFDSADQIMLLPEVPEEFEMAGDWSYQITKNQIVGCSSGNTVGVICKIDDLSETARKRLSKSLENGRDSLKRLVLACADYENELIDNAIEDSFIPSISFACLGQLLFKNGSGGMSEAIIGLANGKVSVLDFLPDEKRDLSAAEKKVPSKKRKDMAPPVPGYTYVGGKWHRSATVLVKNAKGTRFLLGTDDSQYFGVQLKGQPNTIDEAFFDLVPEEARVGGVQRQGEWFAVPVKDSEVPPDAGEIEKINLWKETEDSNDHELTAHEIRVGNGIVYAKNMSLEHSQHPTLFSEDDRWYKFVRNTAVRAVSEEGVD